MCRRRLGLVFGRGWQSGDSALGPAEAGAVGLCAVVGGGWRTAKSPAARYRRSPRGIWPPCVMEQMTYLPWHLIPSSDAASPGRVAAAVLVALRFSLAQGAGRGRAVLHPGCGSLGELGLADCATQPRDRGRLDGRPRRVHHSLSRCRDGFHGQGVDLPAVQRDQYRAPGLCARACRARADRGPAVDSCRPDRRSGALPGHGPAACPPASTPRSAPPGRLQGRALVCLAVAGHRLPEHYLLIRRHLKTGKLAFHYCYVPAGQPLTLTRLIRAAGLRWPVEEQFRLGKDRFGLDESQVRLDTAIARHTVLVMAALAICAITSVLLKPGTDAKAPPPSGQASHHQPARHDPADHRRDRPPALSSRPARPRRILAGLETPPSSPRPLVSPAHPARPRHRDFPDQITNGCCPTSRPVGHVAGRT